MRIEANANKSKKGMIKNGEFSIQRFIEAYAYDEEGGHEYMEAISQWQNSYNIVEAYHLTKQNYLGYFNDRLAKAIAENGISYFENAERIHAAKAFQALLVLDRNYFSLTGRHFKGYVTCIRIEDKMCYLNRFDDAYNNYMSGGHIDFEDNFADR